MGIFASIAAPLIGAGVSKLLGGSAARSQNAGAQAALAAAQPIRIGGPMGTFDPSSGNTILSAQFLDALDSLKYERQRTFGRLEDPNFVQSEVQRLREMARPQEDQTRSALRDRLFAQGRLGAGRGGGRTGRLFNPETAALEEALANVDLQRVGAARGEQQRLLGNATSLIGAETALSDTALNMARIGIGGRADAGLANNFMAGANTNANSTLGAGFQIGQILQKPGLLGGLFGGNPFGGTQGSFAQSTINPGGEIFPF